MAFYSYNMLGGFMLNIIDLYVQNLKKEDIINFGKKNNITLSDDELDFTYNLIKNDYKKILQNKEAFDLSAYRNNFTTENYQKIEELIKKYISYL